MGSAIGTRSRGRPAAHAHFHTNFSAIDSGGCVEYFGESLALPLQ